jgi:hypothetical protein
VKKPSTYLAKEYAEFVACHLDGDPVFSKWAQGLLHAAFSDFAEGYWTLRIVEAELHNLEWRCPATWDEPPVEMTITPEMLVEAFKTRIRVDEPFHPEDYGHLKDAVAKWRRAVERIEETIAKTRVRA